jgi:hypothetical protein
MVPYNISKVIGNEVSFIFLHGDSQYRSPFPVGLPGDREEKFFKWAKYCETVYTN